MNAGRGYYMGEAARTYSSNLPSRPMDCILMATAGSGTPYRSILK